MHYTIRSAAVFLISLLLFASLCAPGQSAGRKEKVNVKCLTQSQWLNGYYLYSWSPMCRRVVFSLETGGNTDIWSCDREGMDMQRLTKDPGQDILPSWSPDGRRIAFISSRGSTWNAWVMNDDGTEKKKLLAVQKLTPLVTEPVWSPDSSSFITVSFKSGFWDLWRVDVDSRKAVQLTCDDRKELAFSWVENGGKILYASTDEGRSHIYIMKNDGTEARRLTSDEGVSLLPCASPDGKRIAFVKGGAMDSSIASIDFDGGEVEQLTGSAGISTLPRWAPDSGKIGFLSNRTGSMEVWTMGSHGEAPCRLTVKCGSPFGLRWASKDLISFMTYDDSIFSLQTINPATSGSAGIVPSSRVNDRPCWSSDGTRLITSLFSGSTSRIVSIGSEDGIPSPVFPEAELPQRYPAVCRQGEEIAFSLISGKDSQIACGPLNGGEIRHITSRRGQHILPSWSADGSSLAFYSNEGDGWELSLQGSADLSHRRICRMPQISDDSCPPVWTGNGSSLIVVMRNGPSCSLAEISCAGSSISILDRSDEGIESPCLSPDSRYVYYFKRVDEREELWRADRKQKMRIRIANSRSHERPPCLDVSADQIVFTRDGDLWTSSPDGKEKEHLLTIEGEETMPVFSPPGAEIAFISVRGDNRDLCRLSYRR
jgi:TolB protein